MLDHLEGSITCQGPFTATEQRNYEERTNNKVHCNNNDVAQLVEVLVNEDWLLVVWHNTLNQDELERDTCQTSQQNHISPEWTVWSCHKSVESEHNQHTWLRNNLSCVGLEANHANLENHENNREGIKVDAVIHRHHTRLVRAEGKVLVCAPKTINWQNPLYFFLLELILVELITNFGFLDNSPQSKVIADSKYNCRGHTNDQNVWPVVTVLLAVC